MTPGQAAEGARPDAGRPADAASSLSQSPRAGYRYGGSPATNSVPTPTAPSLAAPPGEPGGSLRRAVALIDAVHRALLHACPVQHVHAGLPR
jgi:hypothetical protein